MNLDWIIQDPIDFEHKEYVLMDYTQKLDDELRVLKLYPSFQELSLHYANTSVFLEKQKLLLLKKEELEPDEEVLISDLEYQTVEINNQEEKDELMKIAKMANTKFKEYFMIAKSVWQVVYDSLDMEFVNMSPIERYDIGFLRVNYDSKFLIFQYRIETTMEDNPTNKCNVELIYSGKKKDFYKTALENTTFELTDYSIPFFDFTSKQKFPFEESLLPLMKRRVLTYVFQTSKFYNFKK
jgi:hypothetical protein